MKLELKTLLKRKKGLAIWWSRWITSTDHVYQLMFENIIHWFERGEEHE